MPAPDDLTTRLYRLLRQHPDWTATELAHGLHVEPAEVERAAGQLMRLGLVRSGETGAWTTTDPMRAVEHVLADSAGTIEQWSTQAQRLADDVGAMVAALPALQAAMDDSAMNTVLEGNDQARAYLRDVADDVRSELLTVHPGGALEPEAIEAALPDDLAVLGRGVTVKTVYLASAIRSLPTLAYLERLAEAGAQVRIRETLPFRMVLVDGTTAVCSMKWAEGRSGAVVLRGVALMQLLRRVFEYAWAEAVPLERAIDRAHASHGAGLDAEQQLMLRLLADGLTDQAVARQLGVAPRTFTRKLRALFEVLDVDSRFQAGLEAHRRGLL